MASAINVSLLLIDNITTINAIIKRISFIMVATTSLNIVAISSTSFVIRTNSLPAGVWS